MKRLILAIFLSSISINAAAIGLVNGARYLQITDANLRQAYLIGNLDSYVMRGNAEYITRFNCFVNSGTSWTILDEATQKIIRDDPTMLNMPAFMAADFVVNKICGVKK